MEIVFWNWRYQFPRRKTEIELNCQGLHASAIDFAVAGTIYR
jgi:hypothetical protein